MKEKTSLSKLDKRDEEEMCEEMETRRSEMQGESWPRSGIMEVKKKKQWFQKEQVTGF